MTRQIDTNIVFEKVQLRQDVKVVYDVRGLKM